MRKIGIFDQRMDRSIIFDGCRLCHHPADFQLPFSPGYDFGQKGIQSAGLQLVQFGLSFVLFPLCGVDLLFQRNPFLFKGTEFSVEVFKCSCLLPELMNLTSQLLHQNVVIHLNHPFCPDGLSIASGYVAVNR